MADESTRLIIKGKRILLPDCVSSGSIIIDKGKIVGIEKGMDTAQLPPRTKVKWGREEALLTNIVTPSTPIEGHVTPRESKFFLRCIMPVDHQTFHEILRLTHEIYECKLAHFYREIYLNRPLCCSWTMRCSILIVGLLYGTLFLNWADKVTCDVLI